MEFAEWRRWAGETVVCLASGPSMTAEDAEYVRGRARVITVNSTWRLAPWADVHYSSDHDWWAEELPAMRERCSGEFWTGYPGGEIAPDVRVCPYWKRGTGLSRRRGVITWGGNSGYCAMGLAHQFGAARIILVGYDMQDPAGREHWHGQHAESIRKGFNFPMWLRYFEQAARDARMMRIQIINCSRETAITCFPRRDLREALC